MAQKRTPRRNLQAAGLRARIASLYLQGFTQADIAATLGCSKQNVSKHLKKMSREWQQSARQDFGAAIAQELAKLDEVEREAWKGWALSKEPFRSVSRVSGPTGNQTVERLDRRDGNPRFLDAILGCIAKRCQIKGLDSPEAFPLEDAERLSDSMADLILAFVPEENQEAGHAGSLAPQPEDSLKPGASG